MINRIGQQFGNYQVKRFLGRGGFADVYLAEHIHLKAQVAIKFMQSQIPFQFQQSFLNEAKTIVMLKHPHVLRVLDFSFEETTPFLVMDYAPMGTLRDRYPNGTRVPLPMVLSYAQQIGSALQYAHDSH